jgi:hypothetical protein
VELVETVADDETKEIKLPDAYQKVGLVGTRRMLLLLTACAMPEGLPNLFDRAAMSTIDPYRHIIESERVGIKEYSEQAILIREVFG